MLLNYEAAGGSRSKSFGLRDQWHNLPRGTRERTCETPHSLQEGFSLYSSASVCQNTKMKLLSQEAHSWYQSFGEQKRLLLWLPPRFPFRILDILRTPETKEAIDNGMEEALIIHTLGRH